jgi:hypothetical protein
MGAINPTKACLTEGDGPYPLRDLPHTFNTNMSKAGAARKTIVPLTGHKAFCLDQGPLFSSGIIRVPLWLT